MLCSLMFVWQLVAGDDMLLDVEIAFGRCGDVNFGSSSRLRGCDCLSIFAILVFLLEG